MKHVIAVTNQKGGVGKTTTAVNLAAQLATAKRRVVLVDLDPQGNATSSLGIDKEALPKTLYDVVVSGVSPSEIVLPTNVQNLFMLPANSRLAQAEVDLVALPRREFKLADALAHVDAEVVIIDCPPALGLLTINALAAATDVLIPVQSEYFALEGLGQLLQTIQAVRQSLNPRLQILGVVLTMFNKRISLSEQVQAEVAQHFGDKLFKTVVPRNVRLAGKVSTSQDVALNNPANGDVLTYDSSLAKWKNAAGGGGAVSSVAGRTGAVVLTASDVGLSNVSNTSDANKPISTATQTALDAKVTALGSVRIWPAATSFPSSGMQEGDLFPYIGS
jgi:chromosome partitioning protein